MSEVQWSQWFQIIQPAIVMQAIGPYSNQCMQAQKTKQTDWGIQKFPSMMSLDPDHGSGGGRMQLDDLCGCCIIRQPI